ncbi:MAG: hypothetical protein J7K23_04055 [Thermoproteales archaeon]|nr:hypothetical protein [Thermoproteales archaeon]
MKINIFEAAINREIFEKIHKKTMKKLCRNNISYSLVFLPFCIIEYEDNGNIYKLCIESGPLYKENNRLWLASLRNNYLKRNIISVDISHIKNSSYSVTVLRSTVKECKDIIDKLKSFREEILYELSEQRKMHIRLSRKQGIRNVLFGILPSNVIPFSSEEEIQKYSDSLLIYIILRNMHLSDNIKIIKCHNPIYQPIILVRCNEKLKTYAIISDKLVEDSFYDKLFSEISLIDT